MMRATVSGAGRALSSSVAASAGSAQASIRSTPAIGARAVARCGPIARGGAVAPARGVHTASAFGSVSLSRGQFISGVRITSPTTLQSVSRLNFITRSLNVGIVGLPNVGKSTLFNAMVENSKAESANYPFCTIEPNVGIVPVPDERVDILAVLGKSKKKVGTVVEFVDIAGLVKGASEGEGLGNKFLSNIRQTDCIVQVVRCFEDDDIIHVNGKIGPADDVETINLELMLADLGQIEKRLDRLKKDMNSHKPETKKEATTEANALTRIVAAIEDGKPARTVELNEDEESMVKGLMLLTRKPVIYAANVSEDDLANQGADNVHVQALSKIAETHGCEVIVVSAQVEAELSELSAEDRAGYLEELGVAEGGLGSLVRSAYSTLGLGTYFTCGEQETRAWTIKKGMTAPQAAGVIHSDFERGFIRAETISYKDFVEKEGKMSDAKDAGVVRQEGKEYVVQEGDVMLFKFNV
mmetsp:Transcript_9486/g.31114  ORF Transcript_9486/g.31114 Transcript_9486/m.31114 type:complete len:469 (+) Transcript_9486:139-1545(+)